MRKIFKTQTTIKFHQADPAQIMYFANVFSLAHDAFEEFIVAAGYSWSEWFKTSEYLIPIRHVEADFKNPFLPGQTYNISVYVESLGQTSFKMKYELTSEGLLHAKVTMVHAVLDSKTKQKLNLPEVMKSRLSPYLAELEPIND